MKFGVKLIGVLTFHALLAKELKLALFGIDFSFLLTVATFQNTYKTFLIYCFR